MIDNLKVCVKINSNTIYEHNEKINENAITKSALNIEKILVEYKADVDKVRGIYEITVEIMQNILNYSYDRKKIANNKMEANGTYLVSYNSEYDTYIIESCNLIEVSQENKIKKIITSLEGLDEKGLRRLARQSMREKVNNHAKGAGLGLIMMAKYSSKPIETTFKDIEDDIKSFKMKLVV